MAEPQWVQVQQRTFTKWINSVLERHSNFEPDRNLTVSDHVRLVEQMSSGIRLVRLLEVLLLSSSSSSSSDSTTRVSSKRLPKLVDGRPPPKFEQLDIMSSAFSLIPPGVRLVNIGPSDIVDGNQKLLLGLLWSLIVFFSISRIEVKDESSGEKRSGNEALLLWIREHTSNYSNVNVTDFSSSWTDGLAFAALVYDHCPDVYDYESLSSDNPIRNMELAFAAAQRYWGVPSLIDPQDVASSSKPDDKIIQTYVAALYDGLCTNGLSPEKRALAKADRLERERRLSEQKAAQLRAAREERERQEAERRRIAAEEEKRKEAERRRIAAEEEKRKRALAEAELARQRAAQAAREKEEAEKQRAMALRHANEIELDGEWQLNQTAGGNPSYETYRDNPQYELSFTNPSKQPIRYRLDLRSNRDIFSSSEKDNRIGVQILIKDSSPTGFSIPLVPEYTLFNRYSEMPRGSLLSAEVTLDPQQCQGRSLIIIPSTVHPIDGRFHLSFKPAADQPLLDGTSTRIQPGVSLMKPYSKQITIAYRWTRNVNSGGNHDLPSWRSNPQFMLKIRRDTRIHVTLSQPEVPNTTPLPISFDIIKNCDDRITEYVLPAHIIVASPGETHRLGKVAYKPRLEVSFETTISNAHDDTESAQSKLSAEMPIFIVPSLWDSQMEGPFHLTILSDDPESKIQYAGSGEDLEFKASLKDEWKGANAGGNFSLPGFWNNPQYRLTITQPNTRLSILVARADYEFAHDTKEGLSYMAHKEYAIYFVVLRNKEHAFKTRALYSADVLAKPRSYVQHSEVAVNLTLDDVSTPVFIVPCTYDPGNECKFELTVYSDKKVVLETTSPDSLIERGYRGEWKGPTAGGPVTGPSWRSNPKYVLTVSRPMAVGVALKHDLPSPVSNTAPASIGIRVVQNRYQGFNNELLPTYDVVAETESNGFLYFARSVVSAEFVVQEPCSFIVVPSTFEHGYEGKFRISFITERAMAQYVRLDPMPATSSFNRISYRGSWRGPTAGGSRNFQTWKNNPKIPLVVQRPTLVSIALQQAVPNRDGQVRGISLFVAFNKLSTDPALLYSPGFTKVGEVNENGYTFISKSEISLELEIQPGQYFVVPSTFNAGDEGDWTLTVLSTEPVQFG